MKNGNENVLQNDSEANMSKLRAQCVNMHLLISDVLYKHAYSSTYTKIVLFK